MKLLTCLATLSGGLLLFLLPGMASAQNVVVPNSLANVEGDSNNGYPFNIADFSIDTMRYQQVYSATQFSVLSEPRLITAISFRPDENAVSFNTTLTSVQINLSTIAAGPDSLSTTFASNVGGNDIQVFSGSLTISSSVTGGPPRDFDIVITLQTPFLYDPSAGNLLMDVRNFGGGLTAQFDAESVSGDSISRVFSNDQDGVNLTDGLTDTNGLITQFTFAAVPEPTTWALLGCITLGTGAYTWNQRRRRITQLSASVQ